MNDRLYRSVDDRVIAGVCGGLAVRLGVDPSLVRIVYAIAALLTGIFPLLVLYVVMAAVVPEEPTGFAGHPAGGGSPPGPDAVPGWTAPGAAPWPADAGAGTSPGATQGTPDGGSSGETPAAAAPPAAAGPPPAAGPDWSAAPAWSQSRRHRDRHRSTSPVPAMIGGIVLVALGVYFLVRDQLTIDWGVVWAAGLVALGVVVVAAAFLPRR